MFEILILLIALPCAIFVFVKVKNSFIANSRAKGLSVFIGICVSFVVFIILVTIMSVFLETEIKQDKQIEVTPNKQIEKRIQKQKSKKTPSKLKKNEKKETLTSKNIYNIINGLKTNYNITATGFNNSKLDANRICTNGTFCAVYAKHVQIQTFGNIISVITNKKVAPKYYLIVCSATLISLAKINKELSEATILQYFGFALENGESQGNVYGIKIKVRPNSQGLLSCTFYKN